MVEFTLGSATRRVSVATEMRIPERIWVDSPRHCHAVSTNSIARVHATITASRSPPRRRPADGRISCSGTTATAATRMPIIQRTSSTKTMVGTRGDRYPVIRVPRSKCSSRPLKRGRPDIAVGYRAFATNVRPLKVTSISEDSSKARRQSSRVRPLHQSTRLQGGTKIGRLVASVTAVQFTLEPTCNSLH